MVLLVCLLFPLLLNAEVTASVSGTIHGPERRNRSQRYA